jgi:hypothetical protein
MMPPMNLPVDVEAEDSFLIQYSFLLAQYTCHIYMFNVSF